MTHQCDVRDTCSMDPACENYVNCELADDMPPITEIRRWQIRPGDRLIVRVADRQVSQYEEQRMREIVRERLQLPPDFPVLVTDRGIDVEVANGATV